MNKRNENIENYRNYCTCLLITIAYVGFRIIFHHSKITPLENPVDSTKITIFADYAQITPDSLPIIDNGSLPDTIVWITDQKEIKEVCDSFFMTSYNNGPMDWCIFLPKVKLDFFSEGQCYSAAISDNQIKSHWHAFSKINLENMIRRNVEGKTKKSVYRDYFSNDSVMIGAAE